MRLPIPNLGINGLGQLGFGRGQAAEFPTAFWILVSDSTRFPA